MLLLVCWSLLHFALAAAGTWLAIRYAMRRQLLDQPGERRSHAMPTPRGGGIAIVVVVLLGMTWLAVRHPEHAVPLVVCALGLALVAGVGWVDDHTDLPAWPRLLVQALAASMVAWVVYHASAVMSDAIFAFVLIVVMVNVWNFMDGINGLAASQAAIAAVGLALVLGAGPWAWLAAGLFSATAGFLPFNFPKARVFLGDVGSGALGYLLALLILVVFMEHRRQWPFLLLPASVFLIDAGFTLAMRMLRKERWWEPHVQHAYQAWSRRLGSHVPVAIAYATCSLLAVVLMLFALRSREPVLNWACFAWYGALVMAWARLRRDVRLTEEAS